MVLFRYGEANILGDACRCKDSLLFTLPRRRGAHRAKTDHAGPLWEAPGSVGIRELLVRGNKGGERATNFFVWFPQKSKVGSVV